MKIYVGFFVLAAAAGAAAAQDTPMAPPPAPMAAPTLAQPAKLLSELSVYQGSSMKNSPFSAEEVNESVQILADGNRIVHSSTGKMYRNSEGRIRRESHGGLGGVLGTPFAFMPSISIVDPVVRQKYELDAQLKTAKVYELNAGQGITIAGAATPTDPKAAEELIAKLKAEGKLIPTAKADGPTAPVAVRAAAAADQAAYAQGFAVAAQGFGTAAKTRYEVKTEELGTRDFEGVSAEGTRRVTIIPADAIGNERPIEVVYERWFSKDLGVVVYSKTTDPRSGEQTYKLTNIVRSEPDPSLFSVPTEYRKVGQQGAIYRTTAPARTEAVRSGTPAPNRAVTAPRTVSASGIKP